MNGEPEISQSEWQGGQSQSRQKPPMADAPRPTYSASYFVGVLIADLFIVGIAFMVAIGIGFQSWSEPQDVSQSLAGKQEGQVLAAAAIACTLLVLVGLVAWARRALAAVAMQVIAIIIVLVVAASMALNYHHIAQTHPMSWPRFMPHWHQTSI
jgi:hypothetical protein